MADEMSPPLFPCPQKFTFWDTAQLPEGHPVPQGVELFKGLGPSGRRAAEAFFPEVQSAMPSDASRASRLPCERPQ